MYTVTGDKGTVETSEIGRLLTKENFKQTFCRVFHTLGWALSELGVQDLPQQWHPTTVVALWLGGDNLSHRAFMGSRLSSCSSFPLGHASTKQNFQRQIMQLNPSEKSTFWNIYKYKFTEFCSWCVQRCGLKALSKHCKHAMDYSITYIPTIT